MHQGVVEDGSVCIKASEREFVRVYLCAQPVNGEQLFHRESLLSMWFIVLCAIAPARR
jgi:hypothetical protein